MATPEAIHCIKSSRDRRKLGVYSTGNPVARKQAPSGWKFLFGKQQQQSIQAIKKELAAKSIAKALSIPLGKDGKNIFPGKDMITVCHTLAVLQFYSFLQLLKKRER